MSESKPKVSVVGVLLVLVGAGLMLERLDVIDIGFGRIVWFFLGLLGGWMVFRAFLDNERGKAFWGTVLFLYAIFFFLRSSGVVEFYGRTMIPAALLIVGLGFLMMFIQNPRAWQVLIPAVILGGLGTVFILADIGYFYRWDVVYVLRTYWPAILILVGISLVLKRHGRHLPPSGTPAGGESPSSGGT